MNYIFSLTFLPKDTLLETDERGNIVNKNSTTSNINDTCANDEEANQRIDSLVSICIETLKKQKGVDYYLVQSSFVKK